MTVTFQSIPLEEGMFLVATDASWSNADDLKSQAGHVILFAHEDVSKEKWAKVSPLRWRSCKLERRTQSTLGAELMALSRGMAEVDWMRSLLAEALYSEYTLQSDKKLRETFHTGATVDNKPIYDHTMGEGIVVKDKRVAIDMLLVRRDIRNTNMQLRWVDTRQMIADSLTKTTADPSFLRFLSRYGEYVLVGPRPRGQVPAMETEGA